MKFKKDKIFLMGFSWGSALALLLVNKYPQDYHCVISVAQIVNGISGEKLSLEFILGEAKKRNDFKAIKDLEGILYNLEDPKSLMKQIFIERKYLLKYGGVYKTKTSYSHEAQSLLRSKEYSFMDFLLWPLGCNKSLKKMWPEVMQLNLFELIPIISVPVVFFSGKYDMNAPYPMVKEYYNFVNAPEGKDLITFENSAHAVFWDETSNFSAEVIKVLKKYSNVK